MSAPTVSCRLSTVALNLAVLASLVAAAAAQLQLPPWGSAFAVHRGPSVTFTLLVAADGSQATRLRVDHQTPGVHWALKPMHGGVTLHLVAPVPRLTQPGTFPLTLEVDFLASEAPLGLDTAVRSSDLPGDLAITSLGLELEMLDRPGQQAVLVPVFSGGEFVEPASSIPLGKPIDSLHAHSAQATAYYSDDGTGLMLFALDPAGTKPKHFRYESGLTGGGAKTLRLALEYWLPNGNVGGLSRVTPVRTRIAPYLFDPRLGTGWYQAAQIYRKWLEAKARGPGDLLEMGPLETRTDVPQWMKETDLLISEQFGWYPQASLVENPLLHLLRLKAELGVDNILVGLWFWSDRLSPTGRIGGYDPLPSTALQVKLLRTLGIRCTGYTLPSAFDLANPLLATSGLSAHAVQNRALQDVVDFGGLDPLNNPIQLLAIDLAAPATTTWHASLAARHAKDNGMSGFYVDAPVNAGIQDWQRLAGQDVGTAEVGLKGLVNVIRGMQAGARSVGEDFVVHHESAFEWLVRCAGVGQGPVGPLGRAYPGETRTRGVPFFQAIYSGYTQFWPADEGLGTQTLLFVPDAYGDFAQNNMSRLLAEGFTWGGMPNHSEILLATGLLYYELPVPPVPPDLHASWLLHKQLLTRLIALRKLGRPWLVYGRMLASPVASGDMVQVTVKRLFGNVFTDETYDKLKVPTTAWQARDGSIRLIAANGSGDAGTVRLDLRRIDLPQAKSLVEVGGSRVWSIDASRQISITLDGGTAVLLMPKS